MRQRASIRSDVVRSGARWCAIAIALATLVTCAAAGTVEHVVEFDEQDLQVTVLRGYDLVTMAGCDVTREVGRPQLPAKAVTVALPAGSRVTALEIASADSKELLRRFSPWPAQRPQILPIPGVALPAWEFAAPERSVYAGPEAYPAAVAELVSSGRVAGNPAVGLVVHPLQFLPDSGKLRFFRRVVLKIHYEEGPAAAPVGHRPAVGTFGRAVLANTGTIAPSRRSVRTGETFLDDADFEYVIIAVADHAAAFTPLAEWKTAKGVPAAVVTVEWIDATYSGADGAEKIRSFIADAHDNWGTVWILLGGDTSWVATRSAYAMTCEAGGHPDEDALACDLYFSDLDGTWNDDGDEIYGEVTDGIDLYADVFVGRASVTSTEEAETFVSKVLAYEKATASGYQGNMLMAAEVLWSDPFTDSGIALNWIDRDYVPPRYDPITKLYETLGNESVESVIAAIGEGKGHFLHSGHAWYTVMGCGDGYMNRGDVDGLTNAAEQPVVYSIGCWPAAFDLDESCIAEHFLRNPGGGAVAFYGNSRYGWASPGNPGFGYSERFMQEFYRLLFVEEVRSAGATLAAAKAALIPFSQSENVYRWHQYELNLLGDPEMPIWTDEPATMTVSHPDSVVAGASSFDVAAWTSRGPAENALVCVANGSDVYQRARTGANGTVTLPIDTTMPDSLRVTVTGPDCRPYEASVSVHMSGVYLRSDGFTLDDSFGNGDGLAGPGEALDLVLSIRNFGTDGAVGVSAALSTADTWIDVTAGESSYPDIPGGATATGLEPFAIAVGEDCPDGHVAMLDLVITSAGARGSWTGAVALTVAAPVLTVGSYDIDDVWGGDGDGVLEPGESARLMIEIANDGLAGARSVDATLSTADENVTVTGASAFLGDVEAGSSAHAVFDIEIDGASPVPHFPELKLSLATLEGVVAMDTLVVAVGSAGFAHDFEQGESGWTHSGVSDLWTLTSHRSHSGETSWYCGSTGTWEYTDDMDSRLVSPPLVLGEDMALSFWCWYSLPIYHEDGLFVEVVSEGGTVDTLDFLGSGGALETLGSIGNDWLEYRYALDEGGGDTVRIRFRFSSDSSEVDEGVYIDDVAVTTAIVPSGTGVAENEIEQSTIATLHQNCPNPFSPSTAISFSTRGAGEVALAVYNVQGRLIRTLVAETVSPGDHTVTWDGKDELGVDVAAGVYLYRLVIGEHEEARKMILVR